MPVLSYRLISDFDKPDYREFLFDKEVTEPAGFLCATNEQELDQLFNRMCLNRVISIIYQDKAIGYVSFYPETLDQFPNKRCVGIGFVIAKRYQNKGFGTEMLSFISDYLKTRFDIVVADAFVENGPSNHLIKRCGFTYLEDYEMFFDGLNATKKCHSYIK